MKKLETRKELFKILETLPEYQIPLVLAYIQSLKKSLEEQEKRLKDEVFMAYLHNLPEEDEELSVEELRRIEESRAAACRGEVVSHREVRKELLGK